MLAATLSTPTSTSTHRATHMNGPNQATLIVQIGDSRPVTGELRYTVLSDTTCELSISAADDWRGKGLGSPATPAIRGRCGS
jgi:hypothetical protein